MTFQYKSINSLNDFIKEENILINFTSNDTALIKREKFDIDIAFHLVQSNKINLEEKKRIKKMIKERKDGNTYEAMYLMGKKANGDIGRLCVKNGVGLQGLSKDVRNALAERFYWDLDIKNCQLELMRQVADAFHWKNDALTYYCVNREEIFEKLLAENELYTRDFVKTEFIRILFGGIPNEDTPEWIVNEFHPEIVAIMNNVCLAYPSLEKKVRKYKNINIQGTVMSLFLQSIEREILLNIDKYLNSIDRKMDVLIFDGGLVEKKPNETCFPTELLKEMSLYLKQHTFFDLEIIEKPLTTTIEPEGVRKLQLDKTYPFIKAEFEQKHFKCVTKGCYYEERRDENDCIILKKRSQKELIESFLHITYEEETEKGIIEKTFIKQWILDSSIRLYDDVGFYPPPLKIPNNYFNIFKGFRINTLELPPIENNQMEKVDEKLEFVINHLKYIFGDENFDYVMKWTAFLIQQPAVKGNVMLLCKSKQGIGKGCYYELLKKVIGEGYCASTVKVERDVLGEFNELMENKLLVLMDEMNLTLSAKHADCIKDLCTSTKMTINRKGEKKYMSSNYLHLISYSNNEYPWIITDDDRRSFAIDRGNLEPIGGDYYNDLYDIINDDYVVKAFYDYIMSIDIKNYNLSKNRPNTTFMKELKQISRPLEINFVIDLIDTLKTNTIFSATELYNSFTSFLEQNYKDNKYSTNIIKFGLKFSKLEINGIVRERTRNGTLYYFELEKIKEYMYMKEYIEKPTEHIRLLPTSEFKRFNRDNSCTYNMPIVEL